MLKYFLLITLITFVVGQEFGRGGCPDTRGPEDPGKWDISKYLGVWYEIARTENIWEIGLKCVTANYTLKNDGTIRVENKGVSQKQNKTNVSIGTARIDNPINLLKVKFSKWSPEAPYWIADTDFDRYSLVISCMDLFNAVKIESAWILSRTATLDNRIVDKLFNKLSDLGIARSAMKLVDQTNCPL